MSRAFVKEADADACEDLPDRPIPPHPNIVTARGLALIEDALAQAKAAFARAQIAGERAALARHSRDLRYWTARRANAELGPAPAQDVQVQFAHRVTILRDDGRRQSFRIVGQDEADPAQGTISYVSPLAQALLGKRKGDVVAAGTGEAEIVVIDY